MFRNNPAPCDNSCHGVSKHCDCSGNLAQLGGPDEPCGRQSNGERNVQPGHRADDTTEDKAHNRREQGQYKQVDFETEHDQHHRVRERCSACSELRFFAAHARAATAEF